MRMERRCGWNDDADGTMRRMERRYGWNDDADGTTMRMERLFDLTDGADGTTVHFEQQIGCNSNTHPDFSSPSELSGQTSDIMDTFILQPALDNKLEAKAVKLLKSVNPKSRATSDAFLYRFASNYDDSVTAFVQYFGMLLSSVHQSISTAAMKMIYIMLNWCSAKSQLALVQADLIPLIIITLNPLSLPFTKAADIHTNLMKIVDWSLWLAIQYGLRQPEIINDNEQHTVQETALTKVLAPAETYICHLCVNRLSIIDGEQSEGFMELLTQLLRFSPYYQPTMEVVLHMPIVLTIPSRLTFFENDDSIWSFLSDTVDNQRDWNEKGGEARQMWKKVLRMLRMEGIEDVIEEKLRNDKNGSFGGVFLDGCNTLLQHSSHPHHPHPTTLFPSLVIAQLGRAQHRVRCGSDLEVVRKDSGQMESTRLFLLISKMLTKATRQFHPNLTRTSNRGRLHTRQTRPPSRLDPVALKSIFSCDSASDHFNTLSLCGGVDSGTIAGHLMKMSLDTPPDMHSPLRLHRQSSLTRINPRSVSAFGGLWVFGGRSEEKLLLSDVHAFARQPTRGNYPWLIESNLRFGRKQSELRAKRATCFSSVLA
ncbi:hypothetical protein BLNAU_11723 [Blattamonas nauphoetae]|uniref:Uncharacterized protein n=1 Tax=Blattamonas nauphoetae TaxID=2049346 RepID=A0ABQ9XS76_9EUKA|nr:hypothetical protein BLNAU_11723 [Blattamonas nauphoetae]